MCKRLLIYIEESIILFNCRILCVRVTWHVGGNRTDLYYFRSSCADNVWIKLGKVYFTNVYKHTYVHTHIYIFIYKVIIAAHQHPGLPTPHCRSQVFWCGNQIKLSGQNCLNLRTPHTHVRMYVYIASCVCLCV